VASYFIIIGAAFMAVTTASMVIIAIAGTGAIAAIG
jgi:hypothetical protein